MFFKLISIENNGILGWNDDSCTVRRSFLCKRSCGTVVEEDLEDDEDDDDTAETGNLEESGKSRILFSSMIFFAIMFTACSIMLAIKIQKLKSTQKIQEILSIVK